MIGYQVRRRTTKELGVSVKTLWGWETGKRLPSAQLREQASQFIMAARMPGRSPQGKQTGPASRFVAETLFQFHQCARTFLFHRTKHCHLRVVESCQYPYFLE